MVVDLSYILLLLFIILLIVVGINFIFSEYEIPYSEKMKFISTTMDNMMNNNEKIWLKSSSIAEKKI